MQTLLLLTPFEVLRLCSILTQFALGAVAESADPALLALAAERPAALSALAAGQGDALVAHLPLPPDVATENRANHTQ